MEIRPFNLENMERESSNRKVNCFGDWFDEKGHSIDFKQITKTEFNEILSDFYGTIRSSKGEKYGISN